MGASSRQAFDAQVRDERLRDAAGDLLDALRRSQAALAMFVAPSAIRVTTVASAWANAVEAEAIASAAIARAEGR